MKKMYSEVDERNVEAETSEEHPQPKIGAEADGWTTDGSRNILVFIVEHGPFFFHFVGFSAFILY